MTQYTSLIAQNNINEFIARYGLVINSKHSRLINDLKQLICQWGLNNKYDGKHICPAGDRVFNLMLNYELKEKESQNFYRTLEISNA